MGRIGSGEDGAIDAIRMGDAYVIASIARVGASATLPFVRMDGFAVVAFANTRQRVRNWLMYGRVRFAIRSREETRISSDRVKELAARATRWVALETLTFNELAPLAPHGGGGDPHGGAVELSVT